MTNISFPINNVSASNTNITGTEALLGIVVAHATADNAFGPNGMRHATSAVRGLLRLTSTLHLLGTAMVASAYRNISAERALESGGVVNSESLSEQTSVIADAIEADRK